MATKIENYNNFEVNGKTFIGNFPVFVSDSICPIEQVDDFEDQLEKQLKEISEN